MKWTHLHSCVAAAVFFIGMGYWAANNIVFAGDYGRYQQQQEIRWMLYDERQIYNEYRDMERIRNKSHADKLRLKDLEHDMKLKRDEIRGLRGR